MSVCHATLRNATPHTVQLCALLLLPPPETRASGPILLDPFGVSHQEAFLDDPKGQAVTLPPGATYTATLALRRGPGAAPGPFYHCLVGVLIVPAEVAMLPPTSTQLHLPPPPPFPPTPPLPPASHPVPGAFHAPTPYPHAPAASTQGTGGPKRPPARGMPPNAVQLSRDAGAEQCAVLLAGCLVTGTLCEAKEVAGELDPDAKPFVATDDATLFARGAGYVERAPHVQLFPTQALFSEQDLTRLMLGRPPLSIDSYAMRLRGRGTGAPLPSAAETRPVLSQASVMEEGAWPGAGEGVRDRGVVQALRRYAALLAIDEAVTGTHIRGLDMFTSKLRLAAVAPGAGRGMPARYWVLPSAGMGGANAPPGLPFPGPVLSAVLGSHGGMNPAQASAIAAAWGLPARSTAGWYALGALEVPGLPEKHPDLFFGFPVHVRLASDKEAAEFVCLTVTTAPPAGERAAMALVLVPPSLQASLCEWCRDAAFPGLAVHVRCVDAGPPATWARLVAQPCLLWC